MVISKAPSGNILASPGHPREPSGNNGLRQSPGFPRHPLWTSLDPLGELSWYTRAAQESLNVNNWTKSLNKNPIQQLSFSQYKDFLRKVVYWTVKYRLPKIWTTLSSWTISWFNCKFDKLLMFGHSQCTMQATGVQSGLQSCPIPVSTLKQLRYCSNFHWSLWGPIRSCGNKREIL